MGSAFAAREPANSKAAAMAVSGFNRSGSQKDVGSGSSAEGRFVAKEHVGASAVGVVRIM